MSAQRGYILPLVLFGSVAILSGIGLLFYFFVYRPQQVALTPLPTPSNSTPFVTESIVDFESCAKAGNPIMESYPRRCNAEGKSFTEVILETPTPATASADEVSSWPIYESKIMGFSVRHPGWRLVKEDRGTDQWMASFEVLGSVYDFEKLKAELEYTPPYMKTETKKVIGNIEWYVYVPELGAEYCDAGDCAAVSAVYYTFKDDYRYALYHPTDTVELTEKVLGTFQFID